MSILDHNMYEVFFQQNSSAALQPLAQYLVQIYLGGSSNTVQVGISQQQQQ